MAESESITQSDLGPVGGTDRPVDVLQVITSNASRGAERFAVTLEPELASRGLTVETVALGPGSPPGLEVPVLGNRPLAPATLLELRRWASRAQVVVAHGSKTLPATAIAMAGRYRPWIYRNIGDPHYWARDPVRRLRSALLLREAAAIVALTDEAGRRVSDTYRVPPSRVVTIANGVCRTHFRPRSTADQSRARESFGVGPDERLVISVGALSPEKDVGTAVRAIAGLPAGWRLVIAGDGPDRDRVASLADELAPGKVTLLGQLADPVELMTAANVLILTSRTEGVPGVVVEAAMVGVPTVATAVGFVDDIVADGQTGRVVPIGDVAALVDALLDVGARGDELGRAARDHIVDRYALDRVADRWARLLRQLMTGGAGAADR